MCVCACACLQQKKELRHKQYDQRKQKCFSDFCSFYLVCFMPKNIIIATHTHQIRNFCTLCALWAYEYFFRWKNMCECKWMHERERKFDASGFLKSTTSKKRRKRHNSKAKQIFKMIMLIDIPSKFIPCHKLCALCTLHLSSEIVYIFEGYVFSSRARLLSWQS